MTIVPGRPRNVMLMISSLRGGGSEQQTVLLLKHLDRTRFTPHLYVLDRDGDLGSKVPGDVPVHSYQDASAVGGVYFPGKVLRHQINHVRDTIIRQSIDVVYDRTFHMTMIAGKACRAAGVPHVSTIVSPPELAVPMVESRFVWLKRRRLATAYRGAFCVVAVSRQAADSARRYYRLADQRIDVIPNPVDIDVSVKVGTDTDAISGDRMTGNTDDFLLVCVGRMTTEKGHADLIDAMIQLETTWSFALPRLRLRLIGDGPLRNELQLKWQSESRRHVIEFIGRMSDAIDEIRAADALVLPSHFEGMPNVVLEAMAVGTPVIATRAGGTIELEHDEPTIMWADARSPSSLAAAIIAQASDRSGATVRAQAARRMVETYHDVRTATRKIEMLLESAK